MIKVLYEDKDILVVDKPAGMVVFPEGQTKGGTLIEDLIKSKPELADIGCPPRYGIVHRLDKDTSGVLLVAKSTEALIFLQKQFINREVEKKYICLVEGNVKEENGVIHTLIARSKKDGRKQKVYLENEPHPASAREAITEFKVLKDFEKYTLLEVQIKTGRRHQIRCVFSYLQHPVAGDELYGFKNSKKPAGLKRQFLHSAYLKIQLLDGSKKEFKSDLPEELEQVIKKLKEQ